MAAPDDEPSLGQAFTRPLSRPFLWWAALYVPALIALVALGVFVSSWLHLDLYATEACELGIAILVLTLVRPWWFWDHPRATILRDAIGDGATIALYLVVAGVLGGTGVLRQHAIAKARQDCVRLLAATRTPHDRMRVLYGQGASNLPEYEGSPRSLSCERLLETR